MARLSSGEWPNVADCGASDQAEKCGLCWHWRESACPAVHMLPVQRIIQAPRQAEAIPGNKSPQSRAVKRQKAARALVKLITRDICNTLSADMLAKQEAAEPVAGYETASHYRMKVALFTPDNIPYDQP